MALLVPLLGLRMAGIDSELVAVLQLIPTLVLLVGIFALVEIELSEVVPAANDNASGVATAVSLAAELDAEPPDNLDVWVVLDGGGECTQEGIRAFVRSRRKRLDRATTFFIALDSVGGGRVRYATSAGWVVSYRHGPSPRRALRGDCRPPTPRPTIATGPPGSRAASAAR